MLAIKGEARRIELRTRVKSAIEGKRLQILL